MKNFLFRFLGFTIILLSLTTCQSPLERNYFPGRLEADTKNILLAEAASDHEMFLINYAIVRHRDYSPYEVKDQSFSSILSNAKKFEQEGLNIIYEFETTKQEEELKMKIKNEGIGHKRVGSTSVLRKGLKFSCEFENTTGKDIFLDNSTFQIYGPFKDHLTSLNYKFNHYIKKGEKKKLNLFADGQNIQNNVKFGMAANVGNTRIDEIMMLSEIRCVHNNFYAKPYRNVNLDPEEGRFQASKSFSYDNDLKGKKWIEKKENQTIFKLGPLDLSK